MKYIFSILLSVGLLISCKEDFPRKYIVKENYEVAAGGQTGMHGSSEYEIIIYRSPNSKNEFIIDNFANNYKVNVLISNENLVISEQKFVYNNDYVTIFGNGFLRGDSLFYEYFSGGPAGQINCKCTGLYILQ